VSKPLKNFLENNLYKLIIIKRWLEDIVIFPFIIIGRLYALLRPLKGDYRIFFFFPFYHTGGAEKVHAQVAQAMGPLAKDGKNCIIYFTRRSHNTAFKAAFEKSGCIIRDISAYTDNKWLYFLNLIYRGIITQYINRQKEKPVVFNGQCNFGYKISPWVRQSISQIELIHSFNTFSYIRIPFLPFISQTVMISRKRIEDHHLLYERKNIPAHYMERIRYIPNAVELPTELPAKTNDPFIVLFVGRGGIEKRLHLIAAMAERLHTDKSNVQFHFLGDVSEVLDPANYPYAVFYGNQSDPAMIADIYRQAAIVILVSSTEGFPMVVIEGMGYAAAILATAVGDIPEHVRHGINGFLFSSVSDEKSIIDEGVAYIQQLQNDKALLEKMQAANRQYALQHLNIDTFNRSYWELFDSLKQKL
jgi:glycosyltransferase involved in cell wall biosynthesis